MERFPDNSRVCFIGDSITANARWIAHIIGRYSADFPESRVYMYGCGISGGSARSALQYLGYNALPFGPTHAVIMLGMNDIGRGNYCQNPTDDQLARQKSAMENHKKLMDELAEALVSAGVKLVFCTPTPYDAGVDCPETNLSGCAGALEECGRYAASLAVKYGGETVDFNGPMTAINRALQKADPKASMIGPDRVHPTETGHSVMARLFLAAQGFDIALPTPESVSDGSALLTLAPKPAAWLEAHGRYERLMSTEWLLLQKCWGKSDADKLAAMQEYVDAGKFPTPFWEGIARNYLANKKHHRQYLIEHVRSTCELYK